MCLYFTVSAVKTEFWEVLTQKVTSHIRRAEIAFSQDLTSCAFLHVFGEKTLFLNVSCGKVHSLSEPTRIQFLQQKQ